MQVREVRIQQIGAGIASSTSPAALFQILISLQEFDDVTTDSERIALINQIVAAIDEIRE